MLHVRRKHRYIDIRREPEHKDNYQKEKPASALPSLGSHRLCFSTTPLNCRHYITRLFLFFRNRYLYRPFPAAAGSFLISLFALLLGFHRCFEQLTQVRAYTLLFAVLLHEPLLLTFVDMLMVFIHRLCNSATKALDIEPCLPLF